MTYFSDNVSICIALKDSFMAKIARMMYDSTNAGDAAWLLRNVSRDFRFEATEVLQAGIFDRVFELPFANACETACFLLQTCTGQFSPELVQ